MRARTPLEWVAATLALVACTPSVEVAAPPPTSTSAPRAGRADFVPAPSEVGQRASAAAAADGSASARAPHAPTEAERARFAWLSADTPIRALSDAVAPPPGFHRVALAEGSFGAFLRGLPLRPAGSPVQSYRKDVLLEGGDPRVTAVAELDVSTSDVQQCADSVIRLHAEWQWTSGARERVGYHFLSGDLATWARYRAGERPVVAPDGKRVSWQGGASTRDDHAAFRKYLDMVFNYASTISLAQRSSRVVRREELRPGDFFVLPGGPGHAILILDVAEDERGHRRALLGQGYMPAQDFHVLASAPGEAWFSLDGDSVDTPFWPEPFPWSSLHRMRDDEAI